MHDIIIFSYEALLISRFRKVLLYQRQSYLLHDIIAQEYLLILIFCEIVNHLG